MIIGIFLIYALVSGFTAIWIKFAQKSYIKELSHSIVFSLCYALFQVLIYWVVPPYDSYHFSFKIALYPFCFAIFNLGSQVFMLSAFKNGPISLTNILLRYHVVIPTIIGIFLWRESLSRYQLGGLVLFVICTFLFNQESFSEGEKDGAEREKRPVSFRWLTATLLSALLMGISVIFTKGYMVNSIGPIREYLILFNLFIVIFCLINLTVEWVRGTAPAMPSLRFFGFTFLAALTMSAANYIYMSYINRFSSAFFFPALSIINLLAVLLLSFAILKERINRKAQVGVLISFFAIYLLSLG